MKVPFGPSGSRTIPIEPKEVGDALASGAQGLVETAEAVPRVCHVILEIPPGSFLSLSTDTSFSRLSLL